MQDADREGENIGFEALSTDDGLLGGSLGTAGRSLPFAETGFRTTRGPGSVLASGVQDASGAEPQLSLSSSLC